MAVKKLNTDKFEEYFQRADADGDGRISGKEAVDFFQGSNLSNSVLAQIWAHADQNRNGFLNRTEFYNALKLVTVAQSKRELTKDIVKAALHGPASAKIPAPEINFAATPTPRSNTKAALHGKEGAASASSTTTQPKTPEIKELFRSSSSVGNATLGKQEPKSHSPTENCCPFDFGDLFSPSPSQPKQKPVPLTNSAHATLTSLTDRSTETKANRIYSAQSQHPWPRMTRPDVEKYSKVFEQVDTDRDGKITAQQARNLFFRLKLPQEVLEIVWGLPDQENDNMLTLREFCIALHLMESPVPVVPSSVQPAAAYGQEIAEITVLEKHHVSQLDTVEQDSLNTKFQEADKKILKYADVIRAGFLGRREFGNGVFLNKDSDQLSQYFDFDAASEREQFWDMDNISQYFDFDAASERE
ncbi:hypothetical protein ACP275_08G225600 [Erythranthe tilingii]